MFGSVEKSLAKALLEADEGSDESQTKAESGVEKLKSKLKDLSENLAKENELSTSLVKKHIIDKDSKDSKYAGELAEKIIAFVPEIDALEYKLGDLKSPKDKDKALEEIVGELKKYLKMGKLWETAEKARIAEE
jgi:protein subunit release factor A